MKYLTNTFTGTVSEFLAWIEKEIMDSIPF
jgi:hypothetical protein